MLGSLAVSMYLLGLTLRNQSLVTIAVVVFVFLTIVALREVMRMLHRAADEATIVSLMRASRSTASLR